MEKLLRIRKEKKKHMNEKQQKWLTEASKKKMISRGDVYKVVLDPVVGSEIKKTRTCVVISSNRLNK